MENKMSWQEQVNMIRNLGPINEVIRDADKIKAILAFNGDRHLICALFEAVTDGLERGQISDDDMRFFRSGELMDWIVNLGDTVNQFGPRELFSAERLDKINYVSMVRDSETLAACYTHPVLIDAICGLGEQNYDTRDLLWWTNCGTLNSFPSDVKVVIAAEVLKKGGTQFAQSLLGECYGDLKASSIDKSGAIRR